MRYLPDAITTRTLDTTALRHHFLVQGLFTPGAITLEILELDRAVVGGAVPTHEPLTLLAPAALRAEYFCEHRELGVLNTGGAGTVEVDGVSHALGAHDALYIGRGARDVRFHSADANTPARYYLISYPAHAVFPTARITPAEADVLSLGTPESANQRQVRRYIHAGGVKSAQLVMGVTVLAPGSVWNTMPAHTHHRRSEIYLYFDLPAEAIVLHLVGEPTETKTLVVRNGEVALSPGWSVHSGCGTSAYAFCWAMGGENQDYADMDPVAMSVLR
ncbi:MAG: 5-dehydro-4-deoxy-D-glucuronate isomerase [Gemmatimonadaceae bacterium]|jgi:4-deoxy-L-threo-5-hexosulose-uronate ketol-isomerase|nr:5-dehydro-4-deoxy-D-glucuronate isomerase [Gemmatimonadaceae bacterium]